jgi:protein-disulfide isomerase
MDNSGGDNKKWIIIAAIAGITLVCLCLVCSGAVVALTAIDNNSSAHNPKATSTVEPTNAEDLPLTTTPKAEVIPGLSIEDNPTLGNKDKAQIAIVEFTDMECPFCKSFEQKVTPKVIENYVNTDQAILVHQDFPLDIHSPMADYEARVGRCVQELASDKDFFSYREDIFGHTKSNGKGLTYDQVNQIAATYVKDAVNLDECPKSDHINDLVQADIKEGEYIGITGTPTTYVINLKTGVFQVILGNYGYDSVKSTIEQVKNS